MTEQMRMKPIYTGADLQILKDHLHRVRCKRTLRIPKLTEHISGSNTGALVILLQCADQKVRNQYKPAFVFLRIDDVQDVPLRIHMMYLQMTHFLSAQAAVKQQVKDTIIPQPLLCAPIEKRIDLYHILNE